MAAAEVAEGPRHGAHDEAHAECRVDRAADTSSISPCERQGALHRHHDECSDELDADVPPKGGSAKFPNQASFVRFQLHCSRPQGCRRSLKLVVLGNIANAPRCNFDKVVALLYSLYVASPTSSCGQRSPPRLFAIGQRT